MIKDISILFTSILLESIPFLLLGSIASALIQEFVTEDMIRRIIPRNKILGSIVGVVMGFFIPACDCAVIPIALRLQKKKVPLNVIISFMFASPIINPVAILSLWYAFRNVAPEIIGLRLIGGIIVSIVVGIIMSVLEKNKDEIVVSDDLENNCNCYYCTIPQTDSNKGKNRLIKIIDHAKADFIDVIKYMIIGALITGTIQVILARLNINSIAGEKTIIQTIVMMIFAYIISLCSTADSLIAKTFIYETSKSSILAFLILGPMIDIKNTLLLADKCNKKFVFRLVTVLFLVVFIVSILIGTRL